MSKGIGNLPNKPTKHIKKPQPLVGAVKNGKLKVLDGDTGKTSWRQGTTGMSRDWDGDPISSNYNLSGIKSRPTHSPKMGSQRKSGRK